MKLEIKDSKDIIYDNYKIHHKKLGKDIRPKKHDIKKYVALNDIIDEEKIIKICKSIFAKEIHKAKYEWINFDYAKYKRELYFFAIKSFREGFIKQLKKKLKRIVNHHTLNSTKVNTPNKKSTEEK